MSIGDEAGRRRLRLLEPGQLLAGPLLRNLLQERFAVRELVAGERVGVYRIERELGRGGMGVVYLAARDDGEYEQTVALKWMPDSSRDESSAARFREERQILANLRHPGIARLIDGGRGLQGHLWFAMEYVAGAPIDEHCALRTLPLAARLQLLIGVLEAVAFAHARLLIHRDIKPRNVLVDVDGQPRLLDFGIAMLLGSAAAPAHTPGFASPEQLACGEIGVASDIWQLGQLAERVLKAGSDATLPADLQAVVDRARHAEAAQRYATVNELSTDIQRFIGGRPVHARRAGLAHRTRLVLRRHPWSIGLGSLALLAFLATIAVFAWHLRRERDQAERARDTTQAVSDFITRDLLSAADPWSGGRGDARVAAVVEAAVDKVDQRFPRQREVSGLLHLELGRILGNLGRQAAAARSLNRAAEELAASRGTLDAATLEARYQLALVASRDGRLEDHSRLLTALRADASNAGSRTLLRRIDADFAGLHSYNGDYGSCHRVYLRLQREGVAEDAVLQVEELSGLAGCEIGLGLHAEAAAHARQAWVLGQRLLGENHPRTLDTLWVLGTAQIGMGEFDAAIAASQRAYEGSRRVRGEQNSAVATLALQVGAAHLCAGHPRESLEWMERAVAIRLAVHSADDPRIAIARSARALVLLQNQQIAAAQADIAEAQRVLGLRATTSSVTRMTVLRNRALMSLALQDNAAAAADFGTALAIAAGTHGEADPRTVLLRLGHALSRWHQGEAAAAADIATALPLLETRPSCHPELLAQGRVVLASLAPAVAATKRKR